MQSRANDDGDAYTAGGNKSCANGVLKLARKYIDVKSELQKKVGKYNTKF